MPDTITLNALAPIENVNSWAELTNKHALNTINPDIFYDKILLDTIRVDGDQYVYYRIAETSPINDKANRLLVRRWAPLEAHTEPLIEGIPPKSDKASVEKYEIPANQYGRYMEFSDKADFAVVDPIMVHYTREYALVAMETLDLLAKETIFGVAQKFYAGDAATFEGLEIGDKPAMSDLRLIILGLKKALVKPRKNGNYHVIAGPDFYFDMLDDPYVDKYMKYNNTTKPMYDNSKLMPLFEMEFYETLVCPISSEFVKDDVVAKRMYRVASNGSYEYKTWKETEKIESKDTTEIVSGYVKDARTGKDASFIPNQKIWDYTAYNGKYQTTGNAWTDLKVMHVLIVGKDFLTRTGLAGQDQVKTYVKPKGSAGVLDPIDQRQSIGFKINSVGFGSTRLEAGVDYMCIPTTCNDV